MRSVPTAWLLALAGLAMMSPATGAAASTSGSISGRILFRDKAMLGVAVLLEGERTAETVTDESGAYSFSGLPQGVYRLTPVLPGQTFSPPFRAATFFAGDLARQDFRVVPFDIRGRVTLLGEGRGGVSVLLEGPDRTISARTDRAGAYSFQNLLGGVYRVTALEPGQTMVPPGREVALAGAFSVGNDFAVKTYSLRGRVMMGGRGAAGCQVILEGKRKVSTLTDIQGSFVFDGLLCGDYRVAPALRGQALSPADLRVSISGDDVALEDFTVRTYSVSGRVTLQGSGYGGCTVTISGDGDREDTTLTDGTGAYSFPGLLRGRYRVTPVVPGQVLTPSTRQVVISASDMAGNDFVLSTLAVEGKVTLNGVGLPGCTVALSGPRPMTAVTDTAGKFLFLGVLAGSCRIAPQVAGQHFSPEEKWVTVGETGVRGMTFDMLTYDICGRAHRSGKGIPGTTVMLGGTVSLLTSTDSGGSFCFKGVPNGKFDISAGYKGQPMLPAGTQVEVSNGPRSGVEFFAPYFIWHADRSSRSASPDGLTWATAFRHPMEAMRSAQVGDKIWLAAGTYAPLAPGAPVVAFKEGVELYGGFSGTDAESDPARRIMGKVSWLDGRGETAHVVVAADHVRLDGCTITGGKALGDNGGGMIAQGAHEVYISNCLFNGNQARHAGTGGRGAGFYARQSTGFIQDCRFSFNEVVQVFGQTGGGGVHLEDSEFTVERCLFNGNQAPTGAGIYAGRGQLTVEDCAFTNNFATDGAGIFLDGGTARITNSLFAKNIASHNGALYADQGATPLIRNCTLVQNTGSWWTGGILNARNSWSDLSNCILWGNSGPQIHHYLVPAVDTSRPPSRVAFSNVQFGYPGKGNLNVSPRFQDLLRGDYRLSSSSPCVDAGDRATPPGDGEDITGETRVVDGDHDGKAVVDMGAYEYEP
jgi:hypothetical protein